MLGAHGREKKAVENWWAVRTGQGKVGWRAVRTGKGKEGSEDWSGKGRAGGQ